MKIKEKLRNIVTIILLSNTAYIGGLAFFDGLAQCISPNISPLQIEEKIVEERKKRDISDKVSIKLVSPNQKDPRAYSRKIRDNEYELGLSKGAMNLGALRHELYHIADGHLEGIEGRAYISRYGRALFWDEPRAILYSFKGEK